MAESALEMLREQNPLAVPSDQPPGEANYREPDVEGIACQFCSKFTYIGEVEGEEGVARGYCGQWESYVRGDRVSDGFADPSPQLDDDGNEIWDTAYSDAEGATEYHEIHLSSTKQQERDGKLVKGILRTGEWPVTPTTFGKVKKPLKIIRDGKSDFKNGIIALSEIVENFKAQRPLKRVLVPFSDKKSDDHVKDGNLARVNTGFVDNIWIEDEDDAAHLVGEFRFTDKDAKQKALDGSVDDVSSGVPFHPQFGAFLEHVCLTPYPFVDGLKPWLAASDAPDAVKDAEIVHHILDTGNKPEEGEPKGEEEAEAEKPKLSFRQLIDKATESLRSRHGLSSDYLVLDATNETMTVRHEVSNTTWTAPYTIEEDEPRLVPFDQWVVVEDDAGDAESSEKEEEETQPPASAPRSSSDDNELESARQLREMRLAASAQHTTIPTGGDNMTVISREELDGLELSDDARSAMQRVLDENARLAAKSREGEVNARIEELKGWGFTDRPGFLKLYRQVALSDDGGPAAVLLSDDGSDAKERVTARDILDRAIDALRGTEGKVEFSDQHTASGNDNPPKKSDGDDRPVEERVKDARAFLFPNGR